MPNLLDLPSELLQMIVSLLDNSSQLQLGLTCKIFNHISLDTFFKQNDVRLPKYNSLSLYKVSHEAIWALRAALWLEPFRSIRYYIGPGVTLLAQICELYHLIKWLPKIESVSMTFPIFLSWVHVQGPLDVRRWFKAVTLLLQVAIEKGCKHMCVLGGGEISSFYSTPEAPSLKTLEKKQSFIPETQSTSKLSTQAQSHNAQPTRDDSNVRQQNSAVLIRSKQPTKQDLERTSLSTVEIHSDMLLQPLFFPWTLAMLSSSRITKLEFTCRDTPRTTWSALLCSVTIVQLEDFNLAFLSRNGLEFSPLFVDLENFFARHPKIRTLQLQCFGQPQASTFTKAVLPNLSSLAAHPIYLSSFFEMQQSHPDTLLHLKFVKLMTFYDILAFTFNYDTFDPALARLADFSGNNITLTLNFTHSASTWFEYHVFLGPLKSVLCRLTCVSCLVITWGRFSVEKVMCTKATLVDWLGLFPSVESVKFVGFSKEEEMSLQDEEFLKLVMEKCPRIKIIKV